MAVLLARIRVLVGARARRGWAGIWCGIIWIIVLISGESFFLPSPPLLFA